MYICTIPLLKRGGDRLKKCAVFFLTRGGEELFDNFLFANNLTGLFCPRNLFMHCPLSTVHCHLTSVIHPNGNAASALIKLT
jgi:hypothetical protein